MYIPRRYEEKDKEKIHSFIQENAFGLLISVKEGTPAGTHIPLLLEKDAEGRDILMGHISRGNEQKYALQDGAKVLVVFTGPHAYISPRWYTQMTVPTWNYIAVHVYGTVKIVEGDELHAALRRLVDHFEHPMPQPVKVEEIPEKPYNENFRGIIGFKIYIDEMQAAYKLSQNRDEESYHHVVRELEKGDDVARGVAEEMKKKTNFE
ncbi:FMN-binding negative transcriptional regulator [Flavitalea sp. BT771]|uniref:FMN-binding negative transcriptional regulator n=1 Tax=Flavitalea sp. BT771 TaxID=3063329 RepID=UPI0026E23194|nr:FMN-binding negative transcriptional regulator [Flavitalea sp. BT771]MDO6429876.1 FMN-binding negative transcriptional regulator [Flavitalea sp. BT771]MDV6217996.1 FMN-binding negative transcriptional regulator [Flavitalea sp. BT771]